MTRLWLPSENSFYFSSKKNDGRQGHATRMYINFNNDAENFSKESKNEILPPLSSSTLVVDYLHNLVTTALSNRLSLKQKKRHLSELARQSPTGSMMCDPTTSETMRCNHVCIGTSSNISVCLLNALARAVVYQSSVLSTEASRLKLAKDFARELESKLCEAELDAGKPRTLQGLLHRIEQFTTSKKGMMSGLLGNTNEAISKMENALIDTNAWAESERNRLAVKLVELYDSDFQAHCSKECANEDELFAHKLECRFLPVSCQNEGCPESFSAHLRERHDAHCSFKLVPCTLNCKEIVMRREMKSHQVSSCSMKLMKCPYFDLGCVEPICKGVLHEHVSENADSHLKLLWAEESKVKTRVLELERWSAALAEDDDKRRAGIKAMNTAISMLETKHIDLEKERTLEKQGHQKVETRVRGLEATVKAQQSEIAALNNKVAGLLKSFAQISKQ